MKTLLKKEDTMLYIACVWLLCLGLIACCSKSSNEMEEMSKDILKAHQGVDIEIKPLPKDIH